MAILQNIQTRLLEKTTNVFIIEYSFYIYYLFSYNHEKVLNNLTFLKMLKNVIRGWNKIFNIDIFFFKTSTFNLTFNLTLSVLIQVIFFVTFIYINFSTYLMAVSFCFSEYKNSVILDLTLSSFRLSAYEETLFNILSYCINYKLYNHGGGGTIKILNTIIGYDHCILQRKLRFRISPRLAGTRTTDVLDC